MTDISNMFYVRKLSVLVQRNTNFMTFHRRFIKIGHRWIQNSDLIIIGHMLSKTFLESLKTKKLKADQIII